MNKIYITDEGEGFPLVLVHGYLGSSEMWNFQKEFFSKYFRVIAPALPGFGESYKVKSLDSINAMAKIIFDCIAEKKINQFHLLGHSMGGMIVQEMVKISSKSINKLICFGTGSIGDIRARLRRLHIAGFDNVILGPVVRDLDQIELLGGLLTGIAPDGGITLDDREDGERGT